MAPPARGRTLRALIQSVDVSAADHPAPVEEDAEVAFVAMGRAALRNGPLGVIVVLTLVGAQCARTVWSSHRAAALLDEVQYRTARGPVPEAASGAGWELVKVADLRESRACPAFTAMAGRAGIGSLLSVSLALFAPVLIVRPPDHRLTQGSLTLYAADADAFTQTVIDTVLTVTGHVALGQESGGIGSLDEEVDEADLRSAYRRLRDMGFNPADLPTDL